MSLKPRSIYDMTSSLFNGLTAVIYDASNGIPKELDFSGATTRTMSKQADYLILFTMKCNGNGTKNSDCRPDALPPQEVEVTTSFEEIFTDDLRTKTTTFYNQSVVTALSNLPRTIGFESPLIGE